MANVVGYLGPATQAPHPVTKPPTPAPHTTAPLVTQTGVNTPPSYQVTQYGPLGQDPGYVAAQNAAHASDANAAALLNSLRQTALYRYNGSNNPYSVLALLKQQDADNTRAYMNSLAARGILASGETGYQAGQESKRYGLALYNAQNALNDQLNQYLQNYLNTTNADQDAVYAALNTAYQNYLANPSAYGNWNAGVLPGGLPGWVPITSPYQDPTTGGGIVSYLK